MRLLRSPLIGALLILVLACAALLGATAARVHRITAPQRQAAGAIDFDSVLMHVEDVNFHSTDGIELSGWLIRGEPQAPAVVLCHDAGGSRTSLTNLAIELRRVGFTVLLFDFRAHGESAGARSTLGLWEKRDVLGAVEFLARERGIEERPVGVYGVGMGAHAAVLAAAERPQLRVLVLDGLYPDVSYVLLRRGDSGWRSPLDRLTFVPRGLFALLSGARADRSRAADTIGRLPGRHLLLLAPASDSGLTSEMQRMYETIPEQTDADGNIVVLPATQGDGLYGEQLARYHERVVAFFESRLAAQQARPAAVPDRAG